MSDQTQNSTDQEQQNAADAAKAELQTLKARADKIGVKYSNNISVDTLKQKIDEKIAENSEAQNANKQPAAPEVPETAGAGEANETLTPAQKEMRFRKELRDKALKLVRVRIANMDPKKSDLHGEIITTGNKYIGTVRRFVPFGEATDNGFHIEQCLFDFLRNRKFLQISQKKDPRTGAIKISSRYVPEFNLQVLPPLTEEELAKLAQDQRASGRLQDEDEQF